MDAAAKETSCYRSVISLFMTGFQLLDYRKDDEDSQQIFAARVWGYWIW